MSCKNFLIALGLACLLIGAFGCATAQRLPHDAKKSFKFTVPSGFSLKEPFQVEYQYITKIDMQAPGGSVSRACHIAVTEASHAPDLESLADEALRVMRRRHAGIQVQSLRDMVIRGRPAKKILLAWQDGGAKIHGVHYILKDEHRSAVMSCYAPEADFNRYGPAYEGVAESFRFINGAP